MRIIKNLFLITIALSLFSCEMEDNDNNNTSSSNPLLLGADNRTLFSVKIGEKYGFIDRNGDIVIDANFDAVDEFYDGMACFWAEENGVEKCGYINTNGEMVIPAIYEKDHYWYWFWGRFSEGLCAVPSLGREGMCCYVDKEGKQAISDIYYNARPFIGGIACVQIKDGKWNYIDKDGTKIISWDYDWAGDFYDGLASVENDGYYGWINKEGKQVIPLSYKGGFGFFEGVASVCDGNPSSNGTQWYFIDKNGDKLLGENVTFDNWYPRFSEGLAYVSIGSTAGYIDKKGDFAFYLPSGWQVSSSYFIEGVAVVRSGYESYTYAYIDKTGEFTSANRYMNAHGFINGVAKVTFEDGSSGYINRQEEVIWRENN